MTRAGRKPSARCALGSPSTSAGRSPMWSTTSSVRFAREQRGRRRIGDTVYERQDPLALGWDRWATACIDQLPVRRCRS